MSYLQQGDLYSSLWRHQHSCRVLQPLELVSVLIRALFMKLLPDMTANGGLCVLCGLRPPICKHCPELCISDAMTRSAGFKHTSNRGRWLDTLSCANETKELIVVWKDDVMDDTAQYTSSTHPPLVHTFSVDILYGFHNRWHSFPRDSYQEGNRSRLNEMVADLVSYSFFLIVLIDFFLP